MADEHNNFDIEGYVLRYMSLTYVGWLYILNLYFIWSAVYVHRASKWAFNITAYPDRLLLTVCLYIVPKQHSLLRSLPAKALPNMGSKHVVGLSFESAALEERGLLTYLDTYSYTLT